VDTTKLLGMCYIHCTTSSSVWYVASGAHGSLRVGEGSQGFKGSTPENLFSPWETCHIFVSFFMSPRFSCPLLGGFLAHGFCQWFSIFS
jgi:hypothetical protein